MRKSVPMEAKTEIHERNQKEDVRVKVLLAQVDGKLPNLALMKISAYHKALGDRVAIQRANTKRETFTPPFEMMHPDKMYVSVIFSDNLRLARKIHGSYPDSMLGGPGLGVPNRLPDYIDHLMPDYSLYDVDYSIGFTTRGCIRECGFCIVPKLEGCFKEQAEIKEFHHPDHKKLVLFDNNILVSKKFNEKLDYIQSRDLKVSFCQGLDARLVTLEIANRLSETKAYNLHFKNRCYYFAWDFMESEDQVLRGIQYMFDAGIPPRNMMVYVLVGYTGEGKTTHREDMYRFKKLREIGVDPFIMKYNGRTDAPFLNHLARWVNKRVYKSCEFVDYTRLPRDLQMEVANL